MLAEKTGEEDRELHLQVREYERNTRGGIDGNDKGFCSRKREGGGGGWRVEDRWPYSQPEGIRSLITERGGILISSVCSSQTHRPIRLSSRAVIRYMYTSARFQSKNSGRTLLTVPAIGSTTSLLSEVTTRFARLLHSSRRGGETLDTLWLIFFHPPS